MSGSAASNVVRPAFARTVEGAEYTANDEPADSTRVAHSDYIKKRPVLIKLLLTSGQECIGFCHVDWPEGRVSDIVNDDRKFLPLTRVTISGHHMSYDFLTVNKSLIAMIYEMDRD